MRPTDSANILLYAIDYCYGDLLNDGCWVVIDDYFGPAKAAPLRAHVDALCADSFRLDTTDGTHGSASGSGNDFGERVAAGPFLPRGSKLLCALSDKKR